MAQQFGAGHGEMPGSLKVICRTSIVPVSELACPKTILIDPLEGK